MNNKKIIYLNIKKFSNVKNIFDIKSVPSVYKIELYDNNLKKISSHIGKKFYLYEKNYYVIWTLNELPNFFSIGTDIWIIEEQKRRNQLRYWLFIPNDYYSYNSKDWLEEERTRKLEIFRKNQEFLKKLLSFSNFIFLIYKIYGAKNPVFINCLIFKLFQDECNFFFSGFNEKEKKRSMTGRSIYNNLVFINTWVELNLKQFNLVTEIPFFNFFDGYEIICSNRFVNYYIDPEIDLKEKVEQDQNIIIFYNWLIQHHIIKKDEKKNEYFFINFYKNFKEKQRKKSLHIGEQWGGDKTYSFMKKRKRFKFFFNIKEKFKNVFRICLRTVGMYLEKIEKKYYKMNINSLVVDLKNYNLYKHKYIKKKYKKILVFLELDWYDVNFQNTSYNFENFRPFKKNISVQPKFKKSKNSFQILPRIKKYYHGIIYKRYEKIWGVKHFFDGDYFRKRNDYYESFVKIAILRGDKNLYEQNIQSLINEIELERNEYDCLIWKINIEIILNQYYGKIFKNSLAICFKLDFFHNGKNSKLYFNEIVLNDFEFVETLKKNIYDFIPPEKEYFFKKIFSSDYLTIGSEELQKKLNLKLERELYLYENDSFLKFLLKHHNFYKNYDTHKLENAKKKIDKKVWYGYHFYFSTKLMNNLFGDDFGNILIKNYYRLKNFHSSYFLKKGMSLKDIIFVREILDRKSILPYKIELLQKLASNKETLIYGDEKTIYNGFNLYFKFIFQLHIMTICLNKNIQIEKILKKKEINEKKTGIK